MVLEQNKEFQVFTETQNFRGFWFNTSVVVFVVLGLLLSFFYLSDDADFINRHEAFQVLSIVWLTMAPVILLFTIMKLETKVDDLGVYVRFKPLIRTKTFLWSAIDSAYCRTYSPLMDFGGWGYRIGIMGQGNAYIVSGTKGLQLELKNGKKRLIGTKREKELEEFLKVLNKKTN